MIFITVGAQMPFDRLVRAVDDWAADHPDQRLLAQVGVGGHRPHHMHWSERLDAAAYRRTLFEADLVVTHAGMGTILSALELGKPIIVMPRRGDLRETRNDHQLATARTLQAAGQLAVAWDESELRETLDRLVDVAPPPPVPAHASAELIEALQSFIRDGSVTEPSASDTTADATADRPLTAPFTRARLPFGFGARARRAA